jgi:branched-chain amino acid transport system ATP-binding protein
MSEHPLLGVTDLVTGYGRSTVVDRITLTIGTGACVGITGPNGHGKTTLLRGLAGMLPAFDGAIALDGRDVTAASAFTRARLGIALVPEGDLLFPDLTVEENLHVPLVLTRTRWRRRSGATAEIIETFPILAPLLRRRARHLSGGEKRMVALARALMSEPKLLLLDEPSLGLSPHMVRTVYEVIASLSARGLTSLVVEESPNRLRGIVDHVYLLDKGRFVADGPADTILHDRRLLETYLGYPSEEVIVHG